MAASKEVRALAQLIADMCSEANPGVDFEGKQKFAYKAIFAGTFNGVPMSDIAEADDDISYAISIASLILSEEDVPLGTFNVEA